MTETTRPEASLQLTSPTTGPCPLLSAAPAPPPDEVRLADLLLILVRYWWLIGLVTILGTGGAVFYAFKTPPIFRAQAVIGAAKKDKPSGASAAFAAFGGFGADIAGSLGLGGVADVNRLEALLKSHRLLERVVRKYGLLPVLLKDRWSPERKAWIGAEEAREPNVWDAQRALQSAYRVKNNLKAGVLTVSLELPEREAAVRILQYFLDELALLMREDELDRIQANIRFIEQQLQKASDPTILAKLQSLLSEQLEKSMMAQNAGQFAYEIVDPAAASDRKVRPSRGMIAAAGAALSFGAGSLLAFLIDAFRRNRTNRRLVPQRR